MLIIAGEGGRGLPRAKILGHEPHKVVAYGKYTV